MPDFSKLDLNSLPVWLTAVMVILWMIPKVLAGFAPFVPSLSSLMNRSQERQDATLHHQMDSDAAAQAQYVAAQNRLLSILEDNLKRMWSERETTQATIKAITEEIASLRQVVVRSVDVMSVQTATLSKLADEHEDVKFGLANLGERINSLRVWAESRVANSQRHTNPVQEGET